MSAESCELEWAEDAARRLIERFSDSAAIDTADYQLCGFILAAATVALEDQGVAARIGALMEPMRPGVKFVD
ncbi:MAG: hypothetical protein ACXW3X_02460 [Rhodoplanes sp.]